MDMKSHPAADIFPLLSGDAYERFKADIAENGQREPVVLHAGLILDGRNRWRACADLGIKPRTVEWTDDGRGPVAYVLSLNLHRRHLDESQRAMVAARALPMFQDEARARQVAAAARTNATLGRQTETVTANLREASEPRQERTAAAQAAAAVNVSPRTVESAAKVLRKGAPELVEAVDRGDVSVSAAAQVARLPQEEQRAAVERGDVAQVAKKAREEKPPQPFKPALFTEDGEAQEMPQFSSGPSTPFMQKFDEITQAAARFDEETNRALNQMIEQCPADRRRRLGQLLRAAAERCER